MVVGCWAGVDERWPNIASIVGRSAAPRGVERKSAGRSNCGICLFSDGRLKRKETGKMGMGEAQGQGKRNAPLIHDGIDPPVRNPMQSFVKELQLKSTGIHHE